MENLISIYAVVFALLCATGVLSGIYILSVNPKEWINRLFFFSCLCMGGGAIGFSEAFSVHTRACSLFWQYISVVGWGVFSGAFLHFILILTGENRTLRKKRLYPLAYLPAILYICFSSVYGRLATGQYHPAGIKSGWINAAANNGWHFFFYGYYVSFWLVGLALLWHWKKGHVDEESKKPSEILFASFAAGAVLSLVMGIADAALRMFSILQMMPVLFLIPISTIFYCIKKYNFLHKFFVDDAKINPNFSGDRKVYGCLSVASFFGGLLLWILQYLRLPQAGKLAAPPWLAVLLFALGMIIQIVQKRKIKQEMTGVLYVASIIVVIPAVTFGFIDTTEATTWAFPYIFIILSMLFNKPVVLVATAVSIFLTQVLVWIIKPQMVVITDGNAYIGRIGFFSLAILAAFCVNRVYNLQLRENEEQLRIQTLLSEISALFITIDRLNKEEKLNAMLHKLRTFFQADQCCLCLNDPEYALLLRCAVPEGGKDCAEKLGMPCGRVRHPKRNMFMQIPDTRLLPVRASEMRRRLEAENRCASLSAPVTVKGDTIGFLSVQSEKFAKKWHAGHLNLLRTIANLAADALVKLNAEEKINFMAHYDHMTGLPNRILFAERAKKAIGLAGQTGKMLGIVFLDLDSFKNINDTLGHESGDFLIQDVAQRLTRCVREPDIVSRFGGDEYLILLSSVCWREDVIKTADTVLRQLRLPFLFGEQEYFITASAGIALYPADGETIDKLIKNADAAMYCAKEKGGNRYALYADESAAENKTR